MFESVSIFFAAIVWYEVIALVIVSFLMIGFLWNEHASVPIIGLLAILFYNWTGNGAFIQFDSLLDAWLSILMYLGAGLAWSFFKWGRLVKEYIERYKNEEDIRYHLKNYSNDRVAYWVLWWPFSILGFIFDDAIEWIISHFKGIYNLITDKLINSALDSNAIVKTNAEIYDDNGSDMNNYFNRKKH